MNGQQCRPATDVNGRGYLALHAPWVYTNKGECKEAGYGHIGYTGIIITQVQLDNFLARPRRSAGLAKWREKTKAI